MAEFYTYLSHIDTNPLPDYAYHSGETIEEIMRINKMLTRDKLRLIQNAVRASATPYGETPYFHDLDEDKLEAYGEIWNEVGGYTEVKVGYVINPEGTTATLTTPVTKVVSVTEYVDVISEDSIVEKMIAKFTEHFGGTKRKSPEVETAVVIKQFSADTEDEMIEISQLYCSPLEVDAHDDVMTAEELEKLVAAVNEGIASGAISGNFDHNVDEPTDKFSFIKAFIAECDMEIGGNFVPEGTPLIKVQYHDRELWESRKAGEWTGWSIGAKAGSTEEAIMEVDEI